MKNWIARTPSHPLTRELPQRFAKHNVRREPFHFVQLFVFNFLYSFFDSLQQQSVRFFIIPYFWPNSKRKKRCRGFQSHGKRDFTLLSTRLCCRCPYGAQERARKMLSDTHQCAHQMETTFSWTKSSEPLTFGCRWGRFCQQPQFRDQKMLLRHNWWAQKRSNGTLVCFFCNFSFK